MAAFVVAVTGGIASGKSALCACFEAAGVVVIDADLIARQVLAPGQPALLEVAARFGVDLLQADGSLDRARLRALVFADDAARGALDAITHPRIRVGIESVCKAAAGEYALAAIPLLAETGSRRAYGWLQRVLVVDAPEAVQHARLVLRDGIDERLATQMIRAQASRGQRLALADDVVINDGTRADLEAATRRLHARYLRLAAAPATR
jgi:dephospho-CoA kinase